MLTLELREKVLDYANGHTTLEQFDDWYAPRISMFLEDVESDDAELVGSIELAFAEMSADLRDESEVRLFLREEIIRISTIQAPLFHPSIHFDSTKGNTETVFHSFGKSIFVTI